MKIKKYLMLFLASTIMLSQPMSILADKVTTSDKIVLSVTQLNKWLADLAKLSETGTPADVQKLKEEILKEVDTKYIQTESTKKILENIKNFSDFTGKGDTSFFLPTDDTTTQQPTENEDTTTSSSEIKNDIGVAINVRDIKSIADKYNENLSSAEIIFNKWQDKVVGGDEGPKNVTDFMMTGTDTYKLQSDIALLEASALFSMIGNYTSFYGSTDTNTYSTIMSPIYENITKFEETLGPFHMSSILVDYGDNNADGKFDNSDPANKTNGLNMSLFQFAMTGMESVSQETTTDANGTEQTASSSRVFMPLPGVFHKGINSLYSAQSVTPQSSEAREFLEEYSTNWQSSSNIYSKPWSIQVKDSIKNNRDIPTSTDPLLVSESPSKDNLFQLRIMLQYLITIPEELHAMAGSPDIVKIWMNENYYSYKANVKMYQDLIDFYKAFGYTDYANTLQLFLDDQKMQMDELAESYGMSTSDSTMTEAETAIEHNKIFENKNYYELLAWTSAFTPFETNLNQYEKALLHVSDSARNIYIDNSIGERRSPVYVVSGQKQTLTDVQFGNNRELIPITLRDFMSKIETGDVMLFAQAMSESDLDKANNMTVDNTVESNGQTGESKSETSVTYGGIDSSTNSEQFIGPIYFSTNDANYGKAKKYSSYEKAAEKANKADILEQLNASAKGYDFKAYAKDIMSSKQLSQHLTESYGYINYMLMHNTLQNGASKSPAVQEDLDKPLYVDFLGNILTHSGIVVVPAMANTTYFTDISRYTLSTAMFLNSYPKISNTRGSKIVLSPGDEDKLMISLYPDKKKSTTQQNEGMSSMGDTEQHAAEQGKSNGRWKWKIIGSNEDGKFDEQYNIERPNNILFKKTEPVSDSIMRKGVEGSDMEFFDPVTGVVDVGIAYSSGDDSDPTESARVFTFSEFDELTISGDGFTSKVALNNVSTDPTSGDWLAVISLNLNHLLNEQYSLGTMSTVTLGHLYSILAQCSTDVYAMSRYITLIDYKDMLRNDGLMRGFASIFESISNFFMEAIPSNLLTYTPTLDNLTMFKDLSLWITPVAIGFISLVVTFGLVYVFLGFFRREGFELGKLIFIFLAVPVTTLYSISIHPTVMKFVFEAIPARILQNELFLGVADQVEGEYKTVNEYMFTNKELIRDSNLSIKLEKLSNKAALEVRKYADENEAYLDSPLYAVQYDQNLVNVLEDKVYMKGTEYYMDIDKLFELSEVVDKPNYDYTFRLEHDVYNGYEKIAPKLPYYHIAETLTYTINAYTEGSSVAMRTLDYGHFQKGTGRAQSYFNSIFYIAPEKFDEYLAAMHLQHKKNLNAHLDDEETVLSAEETEALVAEVNNLVPLSQKAMVYMYEKMGDLNDWLGIKKILGLSSTSAPFKPEYVPEIATNFWFPILQNYTQEELEQKITNINTVTKNFVITQLRPVLGYMSDDTAIKTVALYATLQFNKEFSTMTNKLYPTILEPSSLNNHYISRSIYMPRIEMFSASSNSLSYYLATQGLGDMLGALADICLRFFMYMIPIMAIFLLSFMPLLLTVIYPFKNTDVFQKAIVICRVLIFISLMRFPILFAFKLSNFTSDKVGATGGIICSLATTILILWVIKILLGILKDKVINAYSHVIDGFQDSINDAIDGLTSTVTGESDPYTYYSDRSSTITNNNYSEDSHNNMYYRNKYNGGYSSTQYNTRTNTYNVNQEFETSSYNKFNSDGTGWREDYSKSNKQEWNDETTSVKSFGGKSSTIDVDLDDYTETNIPSRTAPDKSSKDLDLFNDLSHDIDKKNSNQTKKDLDITSDSLDGIEL